MIIYATFGAFFHVIEANLKKTLKNKSDIAIRDGKEPKILGSCSVEVH